MPELRWRAVLAWLAVLSAIAILPIVVVRLPPILDYPNHMARMHVLSALDHAPALARYYVVAWSPIPDLGADIVVPVIAAVMPVEDAMRLFLGLVLLGLATGCVALHRVAFQRWSLWPLTGFLLLYNRMLLWGFLNYLAGLALALWGLAAWVALERKPVWRLIVGSALATAIYLAHLAAFGCYALAVLAYSCAPLNRRRAGRVLLPAVTTLVPPAAMFLTSPTSGAPIGFGYGNILRKLDLPVSIFDNYWRPFDATTFAALLIAVILGLWRGGIGLHPRLRWSLIAVIAAYVALPSRLLSASGIDHRLPVAVAFLLVAVSDWQPIGHRRRRMIAGALLLLFLIRMAVIGHVWLRADRQYEALLPAFDRIPNGATLAVAAPAAAVQAGGAPLLHFPTLAVIKRDAFVPTLFADKLQQPVHFTDAALKLASEAQPEMLWKSAAAGTLPRLSGYDYLMILDPPHPFERNTAPGAILFVSPRLILIRLTAPQADSKQ